MFLVEVWYFLARPIVGELLVWRKRLKDEAAMDAGNQPPNNQAPIHQPPNNITENHPPPNTPLHNSTLHNSTLHNPARKRRRPIVYVAWALFLLLVHPV